MHHCGRVAADHRDGMVASLPFEHQRMLACGSKTLARSCAVERQRMGAACAITDPTAWAADLLLGDCPQWLIVWWPGSALQHRQVCIHQGCCSACRLEAAVRQLDRHFRKGALIWLQEHSTRERGPACLAPGAGGRLPARRHRSVQLVSSSVDDSKHVFAAVPPTLCCRWMSATLPATPTSCWPRPAPRATCWTPPPSPTWQRWTPRRSRCPAPTCERPSLRACDLLLSF